MTHLRGVQKKLLEPFSKSCVLMYKQGRNSQGKFILNDIEVIKRIKSGEIDAFSLLVEKYHRRLLIFIHRLVGDKSIVEDVGQEVFLNVYKSLDNFDEQAGVPFSAWLFIAARNRALSELRK